MENVTCAEVLERVAVSVGPYYTCEQALQVMSRSAQRCAPVLVGGKLLGLVTIGDFSRLDGRDASRVYVCAIMTPEIDLLTLAPETAAIDAMRRLEESGYHQLPVVGADLHLEGFITRETAMGAITWPV